MTRCRWTAGVLLAVVGIGLAGCRQPGFPPPLPPPPPPVHASLAPRPASYLGVYEASGNYSAVQHFGASVGVPPNLTMYFSSWDEKFQESYAATAWRHGASVVIDMDPTSVPLSSIADGLQDGYLRSFAAAVRQFRHPVVLSFAHEMNGTWYPWGWKQVPAATWIQAYRHVVNVFRDGGADNVTWLWTVNVTGPQAGPIRDWWPGSAYVTWIAIDGYFYQRQDTVQSVFGASIKAVRKLTQKPILVGETGIGPIPGRGARIDQLVAAIRKRRLLGLVWFDVEQGGSLFKQNWRIDGSGAAASAFRASAARYLKVAAAPRLAR
jgi:glycosyl hydrolase family 26